MTNTTKTIVKQGKTKLPKTPKILLTLHHTWSKRDINGNGYWFTDATSTITGRSIRFSTPSDGNSNSMAREATGGDWGRFTETSEINVER